MERVCVLRQVKDRQLSQEEAGQQLGLSSRQIRRLLKKMKLLGFQCINRRKVGGNRAFSAGFKGEVMEIVKTFYTFCELPKFTATTWADKKRGVSGFGFLKEGAGFRVHS